MSRAREAASQTLIVLIGRVCGVVISVGAIIFQTRMLPMEDVALLPIITLLSELCAVMGDWGLALAMERKLPALLEVGDESSKDLISAFVYSSLATVAIFAAGIYFFARPIAAAMLKDVSDYTLIVYAIPAIMVAVWRARLFSLMRGVKAFGRLSIFSLTFQVMWTLTSVGLFFAAGVKGFVLGLGIGPAFPCLIETWILRKHLSRFRGWASMGSQMKGMMPFYGERLINYAYSYGDQWIVGWMFTPAMLATYYVPRRFFDQLLAILDGFWIVPTNILSRESVRSRDEIAGVVSSFKRVFVYIFIPLGIGLMASSGLVIDILAGAEYQDSVGIFIILCFFFMLSGLFAPHAIAVSVMAPPKQRLISLMVQNLVFLGTLVVLARMFKVDGVALSRVCGAAAMAIMSAYYLRRLVPAPADLGGYRAVVGPAVVLILFVGGAQWIFYQFAGVLVHYHRMIVPFILAAGAVAYMVVFLRTVSEDDFELFTHVLPDRLQWAGRILRRFRPKPTQ